MSSRLKRIRDWEERAQAANYCVAVLARKCGVSVRQMERFFLVVHQQPPHDWLHRLRMQRAAELLLEGSTVKEVAIVLGYKHAAHFTHDFKREHGILPSRFPAQAGVRSKKSPDVAF